MDEFSAVMDGQIEGVRASLGSLLPELDFEIEFRTTNRRYDIYSAEARIEFDYAETEKRVSLNDSRFPVGSFRRIQQQGSNGHVLSTLRTAELERIEEMRAGGDIDVEIDCSFRGEQNNRDDMQSGSLTLEYTVRASEWEEILSKVGYHDRREFGMVLGADDAVVRDVLRSVQARVERAEETHDYGDYESAIRACRDANESLRQIDEEVKGLMDERKWEDFESSLGQFETGFLGSLSGSEDKTAIEPPLKRDSDFALGVTKSYVRYVSQVVAEEG